MFDYTPPDVRVAKGAIWLDEVHPGWHDHIALHHLDLSDTGMCVLGQLAQAVCPDSEYDYYNATACYGPEALRHLARSDREAIDCGFMVDPVEDDGPHRWHRLDAAWTAAILERRAAERDAGGLPDAG